MVRTLLHPFNYLKINRFKAFCLFIMIVSTALIGGCATTEAPAPPPTLADIFVTITPILSITPRPTITPAPSLTPTPTPQIEAVVIYDDRFDAGWTTENSQFTFVEPQASDFVFQGNAAIKVVPRIESSSTFFVTLDETAEQLFRKEDIISLSFYLNPGLEFITPDDLAVTLQGSNEFPFWVEGDNSVRVPNLLNPFSETLLAFLEINRSIPAESWVKVELFLDEREFDPEYEFFTGFYIKNSVGFLQPYYIDQIELTRIVRPEEG